MDNFQMNLEDDFPLAINRSLHSLNGLNGEKKTNLFGPFCHFHIKSNFTHVQNHFKSSFFHNISTIII